MKQSDYRHTTHRSSSRSSAFHFPDVLDEAFVAQCMRWGSLPLTAWRAASASGDESNEGLGPAWPAQAWLQFGPQWSRALLQAQVDLMSQASELALKMGASAMIPQTERSNGHGSQVAPARAPEFSPAWSEASAAQTAQLLWNEWQGVARQWSDWVLHPQPLAEEAGPAAPAESLVSRAATNLQGKVLPKLAARPRKLPARGKGLVEAEV